MFKTSSLEQPTRELPYKMDLLSKQMAEQIGLSLLDPQSLDESIKRMVNTTDFLHKLADDPDKSKDFVQRLAEQTRELLESEDKLDQKDHFDSTDDLILHQSAHSINNAVLQIEKREPEKSTNVGTNVLATLQLIAGDKEQCANFVSKVAFDLGEVEEEHGKQRANMF